MPPATSNTGTPVADASTVSPVPTRRSSRRAAAEKAAEEAAAAPPRAMTPPPPRPAVACRQCRTDKKACIGGRPCSRCDFKGFVCSPTEPDPPRAPAPRHPPDADRAQGALIDVPIASPPLTAEHAPTAVANAIDDAPPPADAQAVLSPRWSLAGVSSAESTPATLRRAGGDDSGVSSVETTPTAQRRKRSASADEESRSPDERDFVVPKSTKREDRMTAKQHVIASAAHGDSMSFEGEFQLPNDFAIDDLEEAMSRVSLKSSEDVFYYSVLARFHVAASGGEPDVQRIVKLSNFAFNPKVLALNLSEADLAIVHRALARSVKYRPEVAALFESDIVFVEQLSPFGQSPHIGVAPLISYASPAACKLAGFEPADLKRQRHVFSELMSGIDFLRFVEASVRLSMRASKRGDIYTFDLISRLNGKFFRVKIIFDGTEEILSRHVLPTGVFNVVPATPQEIALYAADIADWRTHSFVNHLRP